MTCTDCPRSCSDRGPRSFCGLDRPGRVYWQGVTMLEEHELAPTYEVWLAGCSLRCRFCTVPDAIEHPESSPWRSPDAVLDAVMSPSTPSFRTISLVGGDPSVSRPWVDAFVSRARARLPGVPLVLNTNLFVDAAQAAADAATFDHIVGDLHFWEARCASRLAKSARYPKMARAAAEAIVRAGGHLFLRLLLLPGHTDCCGRPSIEWATRLARSAPEQVKVHVMTHYAPAGHARGHAELGRRLTSEEAALAQTLPADIPRPRATPLPGVPVRGLDATDPEVPIEIDVDGTILLPFVTGELLRVAAELDPRLKDRLVYLNGSGDRAHATDDVR